MEKVEGLSIGLDLDAIQVERGLKGLTDRLKTVDSAMKASLATFGKGQSIDKFDATLSGLNAKLDIHKRSLKLAKEEMQEMIKKHGEGSAEAEKATQAYNRQVTAISKVQRSIRNTQVAMADFQRSQQEVTQEAQTMGQKLTKAFDGMKSKMSDISQSMKDVGTNMSAALTLPVAGAGVGILSVAKDFSDASVQMQNSMGLTAKQTKELTKTGKELYEKGYGESLDEVTRAITETRTNMRGLNDEDVSKATKNAMQLGKTFDADVNEVTRAGNSLMQNYGLSAQESFDMMAKGAQNGMNFSKEMFDNMSEYTISFKEAGFSADEMFGILSNGAKKGYNLDRLNDTMLEFKLQTEDSGKAYMDAMGQMDENTQKVFKQYQDGKATVADVYKATSKGLKDMKGEIPEKDFNVIGKALFGTKWEDQGADVVLSMGTVNKAMKDSKGTMDEMNKNTEKSFGARFTGMLRSAKDALLPLGNQLMDVAEKIMPKVEGVIKKITSALENMSPAMKTGVLAFGGILAVLGPVIGLAGIFVGAFANIIGVVGRVVGWISKFGGLLNILKIAFGALTGPVGLTIAAITLLVTGFTLLYKKSDTFRGFVDGIVAKAKELGKKLIEFIKPAVDAVKKFIQDMVDKVKKFWNDNQATFKQAGENIKKIFKGIWDALMFILTPIFTLLVDQVKNIWGGIKKVFEGALDMLIGVVKFWSSIFAGNWKGAWDAVKQVFSGAFKVLKGLFQVSFIDDLLKLGKKLWDGLVNVFKSMFGAIKDVAVKLGTAMKNDVVKQWNELKTGTQNVFNSVKNWLSNTWSSIKTTVVKFASQLWTNVKNNWNNLKTGTTNIFNSVKTWLTNTWNAIKSGVVKIVSSFVNSVKNWWNTLKTGTTSVFSSIKTWLTNTWNNIKSGVTKIASNLVNGVKGWWTNLQKGTTSVFNATRDYLNKLWSGIKTTIVNWAKALYNGVKSWWDTLKKTTSNLFNNIRDFLKNTWSGIRKTVVGFAGNVKDGVVNAWTTLKDKTVTMFTNIKKKVSDIFTDMVDGAKKLPKRIGDGIGSMAGKVKDGIKAVGNKMAGQLETVVNAITQKGINVVLDKIGVGKGGKIPELELPRYAKGTGKGGHKGGHFIAGDGGENELIRFPDGRMTLSPDRDTLFYGERGTQVLNGKQTREALSFMNQSNIPMYDGGSEGKLKKGWDIAKGWASDAWGKGKDLAKGVGDSIGEVWDYMEDPKKLMGKVWSALNLPTFDAGGMLASFAKKGIGSIKDGSVNFIKKMLDEFMPSFDDVGGGDGSKVGAGSGFGGMHPYVEKYYRLITSKFKGTHFMGAFNDRNVRGGSHKSMHAYGRAFDVGGPASTMSKIAEYARSTFKDLQYVIYNRRIAGVGRGSAWRKYNGVNAHTDHVHVDFKTKKNGGSGPSGSGAEAWRGSIIKAAKQMKVNLSPSELNGIIAQIHRESKGSQTITQSSSLRDINVLRGTPAQGLLQYVPSTFHRYMMKGHTNIKNGYDQLLAFFNNSTWRKDLPYGKSGWGPKGKRRYKNGTGFHIGGDALLGDGNDYEPFLLPNGKLGLSPNSPTLFKGLPTGTKVWSSMSKFVEQYNGQGNASVVAKLLAQLGKRFAETGSLSGNVNGGNTTVNQTKQINIENKITIEYVGLPDENAMRQLMQQMQEMLDEQTERKLRSEGGLIQ